MTLVPWSATRAQHITSVNVCSKAVERGKLVTNPLMDRFFGSKVAAWLRMREVESSSPSRAVWTRSHWRFYRDLHPECTSDVREYVPMTMVLLAKDPQGVIGTAHEDVHSRAGGECGRSDRVTS